MPRSRSRSPRRERDRDRERRRSRSRERRHRHRRSRSPRSRRSRSHSPRRRSRSGSPGRRSRSRDRDAHDKIVSQSSSHVVNKPKIDMEQLEALPQDEQDMMKLMGFASFETTKNKKVEGNEIYVANLMRKRRYRQYMNRRGGFNRPLDFIA